MSFCKIYSQIHCNYKTRETQSLSLNSLTLPLSVTLPPSQLSHSPSPSYRHSPSLCKSGSRWPGTNDWETGSSNFRAACSSWETGSSNRSLRKTGSLNQSSNQVNRGFHSTCMKSMGGGHAHGHDEPFYLHAKHMDNLDRMKHQQLKMTLGVFTAFSIGVAVPVYAVVFQQKKTASA